MELLVSISRRLAAAQCLLGAQEGARLAKGKRSGVAAIPLVLVMAISSGCSSLNAPSTTPVSIDLGSPTVAVLKLRGADGSPVELDSSQCVAAAQAIGSHERGVVAIEARVGGEIA